MKRGRPAKHSGGEKRYRLELGVGTDAENAFQRWQSCLDVEDHGSNVKLLHKALDSIHNPSLERPSMKDAGVQCNLAPPHCCDLSGGSMPSNFGDSGSDSESDDEETLSVSHVSSEIFKHTLYLDTPSILSHCDVEHDVVGANKLPESERSYFVTSCILPVHLLLHLQLLRSYKHAGGLNDSLPLSVIIGSDVSAITEDGTPIAPLTSDKCGVFTSTPKRSTGQVTITDENILVETGQDGSMIVDIGDTSLQDEVVQDDEEVLIQSFVNDCSGIPASQQYSSSEDPYAEIRYSDLSEELKLVNETKCFAHVSQLKQLLGDKCRRADCGENIIDTAVHTNCGFGLRLSWKCKNQHTDFWYSSPTYAAGFAINHIVHSSILYAGITYQQFSRFCKFVGLVQTDASTFFRFQRLYVTPTVHQEYAAMEAKIIEEVKKREAVVVSGDCRMDSPGFSAVKGTYTLMEHDTGVLLSMEHGDKRQVNLKSTNLEAHLFKKVFNNLLSRGVPIKELVTDANTQIISIMRKTPEYKDISHSLDVWHKSCKLSKKISEAAKKRKCQELAPWAASIRNHFWFVCRKCNGDAELLRELWVCIIHHVCNSHEWAHGKCLHEPIQHPGDNKSWLNSESPAAEALREIIFDKRWLNSLPFYVHNRHTGGLESFHNLILSYASKRIGYKHDAYVARVQLAFLDHNNHLQRPQLTTKEGKPVYTRKWGRRTARWHVVPIPEPKAYSYMPGIIAKTLYRKHMDKSMVVTTGIKSATAKTLFPNIASVPGISTEQLLIEHVSRKSMEHAQI